MKRFLLWMFAVVMLASTSQISKAQYQSSTASGGYDLDLYEMDLLSGNKVVDQGVLAVLTQNAPIHYQAPKLPRFAIIGKDKQFYLGIGGYVRGTVSFDWGNPINNPVYFTTSEITKVAPGNGAKTQMSMGTTNIFFNFVSLPGDKDQVGAYIDFNFDKDNYGLDLRHAYLTWRGFMAGYNYTLFSDQRCVPMTIDFEGAPSLPSVKTSMIAWTTKVHRWGLGIGLESPIYSITESDDARLVNQRMPTVPMYVSYDWSEKSYTRASVLLRSLQYRNYIKDKNKNRFGFGVQVSGILALHDMINFYYQGIYGDGVADYIQDLNGMNLDIVPSASNPGKLKGTQDFAFLGGFRINYTANLFSGHMFSQVRSYIKRYDVPTAYGTGTETSMPWDDQYKYGQYLCNNIFYRRGQLLLGLEYIWGTRRNMSKAFMHNNRLQIMAQINF